MGSVLCHFASRPFVGGMRLPIPFSDLLLVGRFVGIRVPISFSDLLLVGHFVGGSTLVSIARMLSLSLRALLDFCMTTPNCSKEVCHRWGTG